MSASSAPYAHYARNKLGGSFYETEYHRQYRDWWHTPLPSKLSPRGGQRTIALQKDEDQVKGDILVEEMDDQEDWQPLSRREKEDHMDMKYSNSNHGQKKKQSTSSNQLYSSHNDDNCEKRPASSSAKKFLRPARDAWDESGFDGIKPKERSYESNSDSHPAYRPYQWVKWVPGNPTVPSAREASSYCAEEPDHVWSILEDSYLKSKKEIPIDPLFPVTRNLQDTYMNRGSWVPSYVSYPWVYGG
jgi:hypothetical protein